MSKKKTKHKNIYIIDKKITATENANKFEVRRALEAKDELL